MEIVKAKRYRLNTEETNRLKAMLEGTYDGYRYNVEKCAGLFGVSNSTIYKVMRASPALRSLIKTRAPKGQEKKTNRTTRQARATQPATEPKAYSVCEQIITLAPPDEQQATPEPVYRKETSQNVPSSHQQEPPVAQEAPETKAAPWKTGQSCIYQGKFATVKHLLANQHAQVELDDYNFVYVPIAELTAPRVHAEQLQELAEVN